MKPNQDRIREVFSQAVGKPNLADREKYLAETCREEPDLRRHVDSLLQAHDQAGGFLANTMKFSPGDLPLERAGTVIGRYKLLEKIGDGGFGVVYMAEQTEPVQRKVALKIIKAGMDTREVIARFEAERQALALMDHPNIAKVLDAGATEAGRPYFVMELVRGVAITEYCDRENLSTSRRLQLFIKVCHAVQHAHQKGIVHRDLKPNNVLVTLHDGEPVPKVIDFGIAKALGQKLTEKTLFTGFHDMIGTPAYMSPEQAEMSGLDIDTRADVYSLGVLLYELLTGVTPFDADTLRKAALDEIRRMIRETEPPKPSTRLQTLGDKLADIATHRHTEPAILSRLVRGDLDWIVMKCLEKDRKRRYETVNGVAADIQRHLENQPIVARPVSRSYRFQKLVQRNKLAVASAGAIAVMLVVGLVLSTLLFLNERQARLLAEAAEKQAHLNELITKTGVLYNQRLYDKNDRNMAIATAHEAIALQKQLLGDEDPQVVALLNNFGSGAVFKNWFDDAEPMLREALEIRRKRIGYESPDVVDSLCRLAVLYYNQGDLAQAEATWREGLRIQVKLWPNDPDKWKDTLYNVPNVLRNEGKFPEADKLFTDLLSRTNLIGNPTLLGLRGYYRAETGRWADAIADLEQAVQANPSNNDTWVPLAAILAETGDLTKYRESCHTMLALFGTNTDWGVQERTAKTALLMPGSLNSNDLEIAVQLAQSAADNQTNEWVHWLHFTRGLADLRRGHYESAITAMRLVQNDVRSARFDTTAEECDADSYLIMAMACQQLHKLQEARMALDHASEIIRLNLPQLNAPDLGTKWVDTLMTYIFLKEAKELIVGDSVDQGAGK
jgi:eukaryotic-like serine/threonine-protein kinase